jgi:hypothetical protein
MNKKVKIEEDIDTNKDTYVIELKKKDLNPKRSS